MNFVRNAARLLLNAPVAHDAFQDDHDRNEIQLIEIGLGEEEIDDVEESENVEAGVVDEMEEEEAQQEQDEEVEEVFDPVAEDDEVEAEDDHQEEENDELFDELASEYGEELEEAPEQLPDDVEEESGSDSDSDEDSEEGEQDMEDFWSDADLPPTPQEPSRQWNHRPMPMQGPQAAWNAPMVQHQVPQMNQMMFFDQPCFPPQPVIFPEVLPMPSVLPPADPFLGFDYMPLPVPPMDPCLLPCQSPCCFGMGASGPMYPPQSQFYSHRYLPY